MVALTSESGRPDPGSPAPPPRSRADVVQLFGKGAAIAGIAVEMQHRGQPAFDFRGLQQHAVDPGAAHAGEIEMITLRAGRLEIRQHQFTAGAQGFHFGHGPVPISVQNGGALVAPLIGIQFGKRHVENRHEGTTPLYKNGGGHAENMSSLYITWRIPRNGFRG